MKFGLKHTLALTALSMSVACGPTDDPSKNSNANNENNQNNTSNQPNNENNTSNQPNNVNNTSNQPNNINNTSNQPNNTTNTNNPPGPCNVNDVFFGQIDSMSDEHAGGAPSTDPLTTDAGLAGAIGMFAAMEDMAQTVDIDIAGATVTATNFGTGGNSNFWVQDSGGAMQVFLGFMNPVDVTVKVGDIVSFKITEFNNFDGHPQIAALENFTVDSSGNAVPYADKTGMALTADDYNTIVRIGGRLSQTREECGGSAERPAYCYDLTHGTETVIYRSTSEFLEGGECMTFFGPLSGFPGPAADSGNAPAWQLNVANFSWSNQQFED